MSSNHKATTKAAPVESMPDLPQALAVSDMVLAVVLDGIKRKLSDGERITSTEAALFDACR